jgi:hypothetical protein
VTYRVIQDLIPNDAAHLKALLACNRVYDHVAMDADEVLAVEYSILILASSIDDLHGKVLVPVADDFAKRIFNGRVVRIDKVAVHELDRQRGFACLQDTFSLGFDRCGLIEDESIPTDRLPTTAILRCFC